MASSWMTVQQVADELCVSLSTAYRLLAAAKAERDGTDANVADDVRPFLGKGFPAPIQLGPRITRIPTAAFERWMERQAGVCESECNEASGHP